MSFPGDRRLSESLTDTLSDAIAVLEKLPQWELADGRWAQVSGLLTELADAVRTGDADAVRAATTRLELTAPGRMNRIGSAAGRPPHPDLRERRANLVHSLRIALDGGDPDVVGRDETDPTVQPGGPGGCDSDG